MSFLLPQILGTGGSIPHAVQNVFILRAPTAPRRSVRLVARPSSRRGRPLPAARSAAGRPAARRPVTVSPTARPLQAGRTSRTVAATSGLYARKRGDARQLLGTLEKVNRVMPTPTSRCRAHRQYPAGSLRSWLVVVAGEEWSEYEPPPTPAPTRDGKERWPRPPGPASESTPAPAPPATPARWPASRPGRGMLPGRSGGRSDVAPTGALR